MNLLNNRPQTFPISIRTSYFGYIPPDGKIFLISAMELGQDRIFEKRIEFKEDGTSEEYWKLIIAANGRTIYTLEEMAEDVIKEYLKIYERLPDILMQGPENGITPLLHFGERDGEFGRGLWMYIDREGVVSIENGVQHIYERLPSGLLQEIMSAPVEPEKKLILS